MEREVNLLLNYQSAMHNMKSFCLLFFFCITRLCISAQPLPDSIKAIVNTAKTGVGKGKVLIRYFDANTDNDTLFKNLIALKQYFEERKDEVVVDYVRLGICRQLARGSEYTDAINELFQLVHRFEQRKDDYGVMICNRDFSYAYYAAGDKDKTLYYDQKTVALSIPFGSKYDLAVAYNNVSADLSEYGHFDSASVYAHDAVRISKDINEPALISKTLGTLGEYYMAIKEYDSAFIYMKQALPIAMLNSKLDLAFAFNDFSQIYQAVNKRDSAIYYAYRGAELSKQIGLKKELLRSYSYLSAMYKQSGALDSAYKYLDLTVNTKDSIYSTEKIKQVQLIGIREQGRQRDAEQQKLDLQNKIKIYALIGGLIIFSFVAFLLYRNNRKEKNAKILLQHKNELIEQTLSNLTSTQAQLVQSEKMASLGELTAGIAHEIQNPLNFVNNFSEVNNELIEELKSQKSKLKSEEQDELLDDILSNSQKINHHGKRADAIVKGMLQHSRSSAGQKEPTDINALCDEYLRLAYHGLRAKDKSFNATLKTDYDETIGNINIIPQDIGRVILNLITNAFYAASLPSKGGFSDPDKSEGPIVWIRTKKENGKILISVKDNGPGIPSSIIDKIFQPFFTTKPTGQGTGLGLSMSYDIVKAHGGQIKVSTVCLPVTEGESNTGTTFYIELPVN